MFIYWNVIAKNKRGKQVLIARFPTRKEAETFAGTEMTQMEFADTDIKLHVRKMIGKLPKNGYFIKDY